MKVDIFSLCHQEVKLLPYYMRHYSQYGQVYLYEGHSTDGTAELAKSLGAIIVPFDTGNEVRDDLFQNMKNNCWKNSDADWAIVCDMDEFIYHPDFLKYLETVQGTIIMPRTYEMMSDTFPTTTGQIYDEVKYGFEGSRKMFLFKPHELRGINYGAGAHAALPEGNVIINRDSEIICMHMRHLSIDYVVERNAYLSKRLSAINRQNRWGWHTELPRKAIEDFYAQYRSTLKKII
ncbi:MAG: glycosyltransferase family 2 protein [Bacteroidales bacterium]